MPCLLKDADYSEVESFLETISPKEGEKYRCVVKMVKGNLHIVTL